MSNLFSLPYITGAVGDKLYFYQTGTSTPQDTYSDAALTTPNSNPMTADSDGRFGPIYFDSSLPDYRVDYKNSALVSYPGYPCDDVPSASKTAPHQILIGPDPYIIAVETDAAANSGTWSISFNNQKLTIAARNDAISTSSVVLEATRSGATVSTLALGGDVSIGESLTVDGVPLSDSGSFTGTQTGYSASLTPTIQWRRTGNMVSLSCNAGSTGTSNSNAMTITGVPSGIRPTTSNTWITRVTDNGTVSFGVASVSSGGTITFAVSAGSTFTSSGTKGLPGGWTMIYELG